MQVATTNTGLREHEQPMSWARALVLATGFFFLALVLVAQVPGYFYTVSTLATLARFEQGALDLGLLALGFGVLCFEISMLYDPKPLIFPELFAALGVVIMGVGGALLVYVYTAPAGTSREFLPSTGYLFSSIWFQPQSIDVSSVGLLGLLIGGGMFTIAMLCRPVLAGKLNGAGAKFLIRLLLVVGLAILGVFLTIFTFAPQVILGKHQDNGAITNGLLFVALAAFLVAVLMWILPVMVARRQQFMPGIYLHGVVGLIGTIAIPLLILWAAIYPLVYVIHQVDSAQFFVQCSQKNVIPGSCTFTQYTGYIICAIVFGLIFQIFALALYFWSTRRNTVLIGATIGLMFTGLAVLVIHVDDPKQTPLMLFLAAGIALLAFFFTTAGQHEFAVLAEGALGCTGQWLLLGTGMLIYLAGFAIISMPGFFESEALGLYYIPGSNTLHDAFWVLLLMSGLAALQFKLLTSRRPMSQLRKFVMWVLLAGIALQIVGAIQGFTTDILSYGWDVAQGSHAVFVAGLCFEVVGLGAALFGAGIRASSLRWFLIVALPILLGGAGAYIAYYWPGPRAEVVVFCFIFCTIGALWYAVAGPDWSAIYGAEGYGVADQNGATLPAETRP